MRGNHVCGSSGCSFFSWKWLVFAPFCFLPCREPMRLRSIWVEQGFHTTISNHPALHVVQTAPSIFGLHVSMGVVVMSPISM